VIRNWVLTVVVALLWLTGSPVSAQQPTIQTFTTEDGTFRFQYPAAWFVEMVNADQGPNASLVLSNVPKEEIISPDAINLQISLPTKFYAFGFLSGETPREMLTELIYSTSQLTAIAFSTPAPDRTPTSLQLTPVIPDVTEFLVDGRPAAYAYNVMQIVGTDASQLTVIADLGNDHWVSISASSFEGGLTLVQRYEPIILAIVQSMRYIPPPPVYSGNPDLPQVYSGLVGIWQRGIIQFNYPADWYVSDNLFGAISNRKQSLINKVPETGQFIAVVNGVSETIALVDQNELFSDCRAGSDWTAQKLVSQFLGSITPAQLEQMATSGITMSQPEIVTINNVEIIYLRQFQSEYETLSIFIDLGGGNIPSMRVTTLQGDMAQFEDQLFAVASTFQYTSTPCDKVETESD
jgi:hypothetical protein